MGGLFVQPPARFSHDPILSEPEGTRELRRKLAFEERVAKAFTVFLCELSLRGSIVEPLSPVDIQVGQMVNRHALITSAGGGAGSLHLRALEPSTALIQHNLDIWPMVPDSEIADAVSLDRTRPLMSISDSLPGFVVGAYYWYARRQLAEALVDGWVVVEQVLDNWWQTYTKGLTGKGRLDRLGDTRTYSAAVRIEVLLTAGVISAPLAEALHEARKSRNDVAHRASVTPARAKQALQTMKAVIDDIGGQSVATPVLYEGVSW